jgi:hypothetical protein
MGDSGQIFAANCNFTANASVAKCEVVDFSSFLKAAKKAGVYIPETIRPDRYGEIDCDEIEDSKPIIKNLIDSGSLSVVIEHKKVQPNIVSGVIALALLSCENATPKPWINVDKVKCLTFIDRECKERYWRQIKEIAQTQLDGYSLFDVKFLDNPSDEGMAMFKGALRKHQGKVVILDVESIWNDSPKVKLLNNAIRYCRRHDIAVVVILRHEDSLKSLPSPDRLVHIWKKSDSKGHYIVETDARIDEPEIAPFEFWFEDKLCYSQNCDKDILCRIPDRENRNIKPGVAPSAMDKIDKMAKNQ